MIRKGLLLSLIISIVLLACGSSDPRSAEAAGQLPESRGEMIFDTHCTLCHGEDGKLGMGEAKDLSVSTLTKEEMKLVITNGRGTMMAYKQVLAPEEIDAVVDHVYKLAGQE